MPTKITVFFKSRTFAQKKAIFEEPLTYRKKLVSSEQILLKEINRISLNIISMLQDIKASDSLMVAKNSEYAARFEVLSMKQPSFHQQESEYLWKNRKSRVLKIRNWRKR